MTSAADQHAEAMRHVERIRDARVLGGGAVERLFEYLLEHALDAEPFNERQIGIALLGREPDASDAIVRVTAHRLRRRLEKFYAKQGKNEPLQLMLLTREYRLILRKPIEPDFWPGIGG